MTAALVAGLAAGYGIAVPVGAVGVYLVTLSALTDRRAVRIAAALGAASADGGYALVAVLGGAAVANTLEPVATPLRWTSAAVLVAIAVTVGGAAIARFRRGRQPDHLRIATSPIARFRRGKQSGHLRRGQGHRVRAGHARGQGHRARAGHPGHLRAAPTATPSRAYATLLAITALNPATVAYFAALVLGDGARLAGTPTTGTMFVLAAFAASASWQLTLVCGGAVLGRFVTGPRGRLATAVVSSVVVAGLAVGILAEDAW
ncbi:lysine transporter LysE [Prauserella oleivorans]|uniref:Lysine transporter LysE n=1 Tax=Prauserella oleivorans TaxID=1478153 RepID=A0ABW5W782_9PSEU